MLNAWEVASGVSTPRTWIGAWLNYRKQATLAYVPNSDVRRFLVGKYPYDYVFQYDAIPAAETQDARIVTTTNFYVLAYMASVVPGDDGDARLKAVGTFRAQFYIDVGEGYTPSDRVFDAVNKFGTGKRPAWLRVPFFLEAKTPVLCRVQNLDLVHAQRVQIILYGVGE